MHNTNLVLPPHSPCCAAGYGPQRAPPVPFMNTPRSLSLAASADTTLPAVTSSSLLCYRVWAPACAACMSRERS